MPASLFYSLKGGRPGVARGKYETWLEPENLLRLEAWARDGLTLEQIAHNIGCTRETLRVWINTYPAISAALKKGREVVDIEVENALIKRALGYTYEETMVEDNPDGRKTRITQKFIPPDVAAIVFYLKNRLPKKWRDKPMDESGKGPSEIMQSLAALLEGRNK